MRHRFKVSRICSSDDYARSISIRKSYKSLSLGKRPYILCLGKLVPLLLSEVSDYDKDFEIIWKLYYSIHGGFYMKVTLVLKGLLLWFTVLLTVMYLSTIDFILSLSYWFTLSTICILQLCVLYCLCYCIISWEEFKLISGYSWLCKLLHDDPDSDELGFIIPLICSLCSFK